MKTNIKLKLLCSCIMAVALLGCNDDNNSSSADDGITIPDETKAAYVGNGIAVYGNIAKDKFSETALTDKTGVILLDDGTISASYAALGLKLPFLSPKLSTAIYATEVNSKVASSILRSQADAYLALIEQILESDGAEVNSLVNQSSLNSQSSVIQATLSVDFTNTTQSASYVRNLVLKAINNGILPANIGSSGTDFGNKIRLDLAFWEDQGDIFLWTGANLAKDSKAVAAKYNDLSTAAALTSSRVLTTVASKESFKQTEASAGGVDILWSIDASGSMSEEQQNLANGAEQFFTTLNKAGLDYRLAVNTQGDDNTRYSCKTLRKTTTGESFIDSSTIDALAKWRILASPGISDSSNETGFYCTREVNLTGFDRPNAKNLVVFVSDEPENETVNSSRPDASDRSAYVTRNFDDYKQYFTNTGATYFAIAGTGSIIKPTFSSNVNLNANGDFSCSGQGGSAAGGAHFSEIAKLTGGSSASICADSADWTVMFDKILETATGLASNFKLQYAPIPSSVKVMVAGKALTRDISHQDGFDIIYGKDDVSLVFYGNSLPKQGDAIEIEYDYLGGKVVK